MEEKMIKDIVKPLRRKIFGERWINSAFIVMIIYSLILLGLAIFSHIIVIPFIERWIITITLVIFPALSILLFFVYPEFIQTVKIADSLGCSERMITAWEYRDQNTVEAKLQREDMIAFIKGISFQKLYKRRIKYNWLISAIVIILVATLILFFQSPAKVKAKEQEELAEKIEEQVEKLEETKDKLYEEHEISEEKQAEIDALMEQLMEQIKASKSEEELVKNMAIAKDEMKKLDSGDVLEDLQKLANSLKEESQTNEALNNEKLEALKEALENRNMEQMEEASKELTSQMENGELEEEVVEELANALEAAADEMSSEDMAEAVEQLANSLENSDASGTESSLAQMQELMEASMNNSDGNMSQFSSDMQASINQGLGQLSSGESLGELAQGNMPNTSGAAASLEISQPMGSSGGNNSQGQGTQGEGTQPGNGQGQGGAGEGSTNEDTGYTEDDGSSGHKGEGEYKEGEYEAIYQPNRLGGNSDPSLVQGTAGDVGASTWQNVEGMPIETGELIGYEQIYQSYQEEAVQNIESMDIPIVMHDIVMDYFSSIE